jgi:hypothetical protein
MLRAVNVAGAVEEELGVLVYRSDMSPGSLNEI